MSGHFESHFPESGSVDYADQSTNIDETTISELRLNDQQLNHDIHVLTQTLRG